MPMDFPDQQSLNRAASVHEFRAIKDGELEDDYRKALADHVKPKDLIESYEIRFKVGWNRWSDGQKQSMLLDGGLSDALGKP